MSLTRRPSSHGVIRATALAVCVALIVSTVFLPSRASASAVDASRGVPGSRWNPLTTSLGFPRSILGTLISLFFQGGGSPSVPGTNLPDLAVARSAQPGEPVAPASIRRTKCALTVLHARRAGPARRIMHRELTPEVHTTRPLEPHLSLTDLALSILIRAIRLAPTPGPLVIPQMLSLEQCPLTLTSRPAITRLH